MKKLLVSAILLATGFVNGQDFKGNISGTLGILNAKIRLQYEKPIGERYSTGANLNYYFVNWTGPIIEPFVRIYGRSEGNKEGFFGQFKLGYGNLKSLNLELNQSGNYVESNKRWSTIGGGVDCGYKFLIGKHFTIEPLAGLRYYTAPKEVDNPAALGEDIGWYVTTGLPLDFQLKFGYQF